MPLLSTIPFRETPPRGWGAPLCSIGTERVEDMDVFIHRHKSNGKMKAPLTWKILTQGGFSDRLLPFWQIILDVICPSIKHVQVVMELQSESEELYQAQTENRYLKETISALREELEKTQIGHEANVQKALTAANDEILQLKSSVSALRDELEKAQIISEENIQKALTTANDENAQLRSTIVTLRNELERAQITYEEKIQKLEQASRDEVNQLQETARVLRGQLEAHEKKQG